MKNLKCFVFTCILSLTLSPTLFSQATPNLMKVRIDSLSQQIKINARKNQDDHAQLFKETIEAQYSRIDISSYIITIASFLIAVVGIGSAIFGISKFKSIHETSIEINNKKNYIEQILKQSQEKLNHIEKLTLKIDHQSEISTYYYSGVLQFQFGHYFQSRNTLKNVISLSEKWMNQEVLTEDEIEKRKLKIIESKNLIGKSLLAEGKYKDATKNFKELIEFSRGTYADAYYNAGLSYLYEKDFDTSRSFFETAFRKDNTHQMALFRLGKLFLLFDQNTGPAFTKFLEAFERDQIKQKKTAVIPFLIGLILYYTNMQEPAHHNYNYYFSIAERDATYNLETYGLAHRELFILWIISMLVNDAIANIQNYQAMFENALNHIKIPTIFIIDMLEELNYIIENENDMINRANLLNIFFILDNHI